MIWLPLPSAREFPAGPAVPSWLLAGPIIVSRHEVRRRLDEAQAGVVARGLTCAALLFMALAAGAAVLESTSGTLRSDERANAAVVTEPVRQLQEPAAFDLCQFVRCIDI